MNGRFLLFLTTICFFNAVTTKITECDLLSGSGETKENAEILIYSRSGPNKELFAFADHIGALFASSPNIRVSALFGYEQYKVAGFDFNCTRSFLSSLHPSSYNQTWNDTMSLNDRMLSFGMPLSEGNWRIGELRQRVHVFTLIDETEEIKWINDSDWGHEWRKGHFKRDIRWSSIRFIKEGPSNTLRTVSVEGRNEWHLQINWDESPLDLLHDILNMEFNLTVPYNQSKPDYRRTREESNKTNGQTWYWMILMGFCMFFPLILLALCLFLGPLIVSDHRTRIFEYKKRKLEIQHLEEIVNRGDVAQQFQEAEAALAGPAACDCPYCIGLNNELVMLYASSPASVRTARLGTDEARSPPLTHRSVNPTQASLSTAPVDDDQRSG